MNTIDVYNNAVNQARATNSPSDSIIAVGNDVDGGRVVTMVNTMVSIYRKTTMELLYQDISRLFFSQITGGDGYVTYDAGSNRFFATTFNTLTCGLGLNITAPPSLASIQCLAQASFGAVGYSVSGPVLESVPANGCAPFTNAAAVAGKVVLIKRGLCPFTVKALNAQAAGAIAMMVYNNVGTLEITSMGGVAPSVTIPCFSISQSLGNSLVAASPTVAVSATDVNISASVTTLFMVAVSKDSAPSSNADFHQFPTFTTPGWNSTFGDFPHHAVNSDTLFISTQDFTATEEFIGAHIGAFDKAALMSGTSVDFLWEEQLAGQAYLMPAETRMPSTEFNQPTYFVGPELSLPVNNLHVFWATHDGMNSLSPVSVPVNPMSQPYYELPPVLRQPPSATLGIEASSGISTAVVSKGSLWCAISHNASQVHTVVRWVEMDVSTTWSNGQIKLVQQGDINQGPDLDVSYPHLDVDRDGNMLITLTVVSHTQFASIAFTGRLATDEKGAVRYPLNVWAHGNFSFQGVPEGRNRWGDYAGGVFDPVDRETFWMFSQLPDPLGTFDENGSAKQWNTAIGTAYIDARGPCPPAVNTCAEVRPINADAEAAYAAAHPSVYAPNREEEEEMSPPVFEFE
jgi:hypothetical protein